ncbi:MAG TPA: GxxExxY protein [Phycisphaerales bacterium]|nr:GxxExxY protein [Phycisphaerales bacterium]
MDEVSATTQVQRRKFDDVPPEWNRVTETVIGAAMEVHSHLGPGLLEKHYERALVHELTARGLSVQSQVPIRLTYKGAEIGEQCLDLVVEDLLVIELKSVEAVHDVHLAQLVSYLTASGKPLGLLINFNVARLKDGLYRRVRTRNTPTPSAFLSADLSPRPS